MNLTICLLLARRFVERERIRELVAGYAGLSDAAFERTFERDKDELRSLGVPVETGSNSAFFPDEVGYRIRRTDFELPPLELDPAELAAVGLASTVWNEARFAEEAVTAVAKLRAAGLDPDADRVAAFAPSIPVREPGFAVLWDATLTQTPVAFRYRGVDRVVEPWRLTSRTGRWYLIGFDRVRGEGRAFKLTRLEDEPRNAGDPGSYALPAEDVIGRHVASLERPRSERTALVAVREGRAPDLVRNAEPAASDIADAAGAANGLAVPDGFAAWRVPLGQPGEEAADLAVYGADVIVLDPPELRAAVADHLRAVASWS